MGKAVPRAVSVGCGAADKEIGLLEAGVVEHFDLWEISPKLAEEGRAQALRRGVGDRISYKVGDVFSAALEPYDLVYWDHALHHMSDVVAAIRWSARAARPGGFVMINDYVGPNRLQCSDLEISRANAFLERHGVAKRLPRSSVISYLKQWRRDPSEAPQSERILTAILLNLLNAEIRVIGGAMINILGPTVVQMVPDDHPLLQDMLREDAALRGEGLSHFACAFWQRPASQ
jgi:SAM-dependent methyltransferase